MIIYGIPSYRRVDAKTIGALKMGGVSEEQIVVSTQTQEDYSEYKAKWGGINVIYREADCAAGNRNTIIEYAFEGSASPELVLLDDDIRAFFEYDGSGFKKRVDDINSVFSGLFSEARTNGVKIFGVSPSSNAIVRAGRGRVDVDVLLQGTVLGVCERILFDERWKMVEDYEISLRAMTKYGHTMRFNDLVAGKPKNGTNAGGLHERYLRGELPYWITRLEKAYPIFSANKEYLCTHPCAKERRGSEPQLCDRRQAC